jgi:hypothetical protein
LVARRILGSAHAQARRFSIPVPAGMTEPLVWRDAATQAQAVGYWPGNDGRGDARRYLLYSIGGGGDETELGEGAAATGLYRGPREEIVVLDKRYESMQPWEINELVLRKDGTELGFRVGLDTKEGLHWWQWLTVDVLDEGPVCRTIHAKGMIPAHFENHDLPESQAMGVDGWADYPWFHKHNHVRGEVVARCYANGVMELTFRHVNGRFFTYGGDLHDVTPVIGFRVAGGSISSAAERVTTRSRWRFDGVQVDTGEASYLVSEEFPATVRREGDMVVYQPYAGIEVMAGGTAEMANGQRYLSKVDDRAMPQGLGRTVRMLASFGDVEPDVAVYAAPAWWYGVCQDLCEEPLLPVRDDTYVTIEKAIEWYRANTFTNCFDDGAVTRGGLPGEPGWEGEAAQGIMLAAYLSGETVDYSLALRSAYQFADVSVEKTLFCVRMHSSLPPMLSLPMQRVTGLIVGYLETGDPYLLDCALSTIDSAYWWDRHAWPRRSFGRDAAYIHSLVYCYRYLGESLYRERAREALHRVAQLQLPDGAFTQQGNTTGLHASVAVIIKPWMAGVIGEAMADFLALEGDETIQASLEKLAKWFLAARFQDEEGMHWVYEVSHGGTEFDYALDGTPKPLGRGYWHVEYLAKIMGWAALHFDDPAYYKAWYDSYARTRENPGLWDHGANKIMMNVTALRAWLWDAQLTAAGVEVHPRKEIAPDLDRADVDAPGGPTEVTA